MDMAAARATSDYPNTPYRKGDRLPTHPSFAQILPLLWLLYGGKRELLYHFPGREATLIEFLDGFSQGCPTGSTGTMLTLHAGMHTVMQRHPDLPVRILALIDDLNILGTIQDVTVIDFELKLRFKDFFGVELNLRKSSLLVLQMHTVVDPATKFDPVYQQFPDLRSIPLVTAGTVVVGVPLGTQQFVKAQCRNVWTSVRRNLTN